MITILNVETATKNCSVSLTQNGKILCVKEIAEQNYSHAEMLHVFFEQILLEHQLKFSDVNAIAISQGPGSYTGLRIGVSSVKGLCYGLDIPLIACDTLEILARKITVNDGVIVPLLDARRMEVFYSVYQDDYKQIQPTKALVVEKNSFDTLAQEVDKIYFVGDGAKKCQELLENDKFVFFSEILYPSAREMAKISYDKFLANEFVDVAYFEPFYLKDFVLIQKKKQ